MTKEEIPIVAIFLSCSNEKSSMYKTKSSTNYGIKGAYPSILTEFNPAIAISGLMNNATSKISNSLTFRKVCLMEDLYFLIAVFIAKSTRALSWGATNKSACSNSAP